MTKLQSNNAITFKRLPENIMLTKTGRPNKQNSTNMNT